MLFGKTTIFPYEMYFTKVLYKIQYFKIVFNYSTWVPLHITLEIYRSCTWSGSTWLHQSRLKLINLSYICSCCTTLENCADTASVPVHSLERNRTQIKQLTSDRGHVIVIMWYEMWLIKGRQLLIRQTELHGWVPLHLTDFFRFACL